MSKDETAMRQDFEITFANKNLSGCSGENLNLKTGVLKVVWLYHVPATQFAWEAWQIATQAALTTPTPETADSQMGRECKHEGYVTRLAYNAIMADNEKLRGILNAVDYEIIRQCEHAEVSKKVLAKNLDPIFKIIHAYLTPADSDRGEE